MSKLSGRRGLKPRLHGLRAGGFISPCALFLLVPPGPVSVVQDRLSLPDGDQAIAIGQGGWVCPSPDVLCGGFIFSLRAFFVV